MQIQLIVKYETNDFQILKPLAMTLGPCPAVPAPPEGRRSEGWE